MKSLFLVGYGLRICFAQSRAHDSEFIIGTGIYDITGPAAQIHLLGYGRHQRTSHGVHQRLRARAFLIAETTTDTTQSSDNHTTASVATTRRLLKKEQKKEGGFNKSNIICFVSIDACMGSDLLTMRVVDRLEKLAPDIPCQIENLSISATSTHSALGGYLQYTFYQIASLGFSEEVMHAYAEGIVQAILIAFRTREPGSIEMAQEFLMKANINRSPTSYLLNPETERSEYVVEGDTDKTMLQLSLTSSATGEAIGVLNWFAVHANSMNSTSSLISGDNKGYASYLMERHQNGASVETGKGKFVAAFASTNLGDVSPNTEGPRCIDTGLPCNLTTSACKGDCSLCVAFGPGQSSRESTEIIGRKQFEHSQMLMEKGGEALKGTVSHRHSFVDIANLNVTEMNETVHTCPAAVGYSLASGTTDGSGLWGFVQSTKTSNRFWDMIGGLLSIPKQDEMDCQAPKPILFNTGHASVPYRWEPTVVPISVFRVGGLFILNVPAALTTMAGRRLRKSVRRVLLEGGTDDPTIVIAGLANSYAGYVTTPEEYAGQRYEAASTLYGPHTLSAYIQEFERICRDIIDGSSSETLSGPPDLSKRQLSLIPPLEPDTVSLGKKFGSIANEADDKYKIGTTVAVSFHSANPRNNPRTQGTFLTVNRMDEDGTWQTLFVDGDWCTEFRWKGGLGYWGTSIAEVYWNIPNDTPRGLYSICHFGTRKTLTRHLEESLCRAPAWLTSNLLGSYAVNLLFQLLKFAIHFSRFVEQAFDTVLLPKTKDFRGCTRTFLVH